MLNRLRDLKLRYEKVANMLSDPKTASDSKTFQKLSKELAHLTPAFETFERLDKLDQQLQEAEELMQSDDASMRELATEDFYALKTEKESLNKEAVTLLLPRDPSDDGSAILEIRAGTGGDEAALFVADLARMYRKYAEKKGFRIGVLDSSPTEIGGFKEIVMQVEGAQAYYYLKNEAGTHRVQRVPNTETQGRVHTSTVTVAVLPETEEVEEIEINPADLKIDTYRSQGAGGQHVNTTDSAVRITHIPTGIIAACQEERSQIKNRDKAMKYLKVKIYEQAREKQFEEITSLRRSMVGTGDRAERIRTYNFPQGRLSDHRIKLTLYQLENIINSGELDEVIGQLLLKERLEKLQSMQLDQAL